MNIIKLHSGGIAGYMVLDPEEIQVGGLNMLN